MAIPHLQRLLPAEAPAVPLPAVAVIILAGAIAALSAALTGIGLTALGLTGWVVSVVLLALGLPARAALLAIPLLTLAASLLLHVLTQGAGIGLGTELALLSITALTTAGGVGLQLRRRQGIRRRELQRELDLHSALVSSVFEGGEGVELLAADGRVLTINGAGLHLLNVEDDRRILGANWFERWGLEQRRAAQQAWNQALQGEPGEFSAGGHTFGGAYRHWHVRLVAVATNSGCDGRMLCFYRDISADVAARRALEQRNAEMELLLGSIDDGFCALDRNLRFTYVNPRGAELLRVRDLDDLRTRDFWQLFPESHRNGVGNLLRRALTDGESGDITTSDTRRGRWLRVRAIPNADGVSVLFSDITEQIAEEGSRSEQYARLQVTQELAGVGSWRLDFSDGRLHLSAKALHLLGMPECPATEHKRRLLECLHPQDRMQLVQAILAGDQPSGFDITVRMPDITAPGGCRHLRWVARAGQDGGGGERHLFGAVQEVSDRMQAEENRAFISAVIDALPQDICVIDAHGEVIALNHVAREGGSGIRRFGSVQLGTDLLSLCDGVGDSNREAARSLAAALRDVLAERVSGFQLEYSLRTADDGETWNLSRGAPLQVGGRRFVVLAHEDATERKHREQSQYSGNAVRALFDFAPGD